jgi:antitoxin (DNA-binding transcriptional repressor) of toxin-antitoxin stability system
MQAWVVQPNTPGMVRGKYPSVHNPNSSCPSWLKNLPTFINQHTALYTISIPGYNMHIAREEAMPTRTIDIHEAQQHLAELVAQVAAGTEIIILEGQTPRARLVPMHQPPGQRIPGLHPGSMTMSPDFDQPLQIHEKTLQTPEHRST